jgi:Predicted membrane protein
MNSTESIQTPHTRTDTPIAWIIRFVKGILAGIGAITPGLSGGVLMVVFGIYEPLVRWLADIRKKFMPNLRYFLPVGIGGVIGVIAFSAVIDFAFDNFAAQFTWLFIGFISGTIPSLLKTAREQGRKNWHWLLLAVFAVGIYFFMTWMKTIRSVTMEPSFWGWVLSGALTGLGLVVPGMSPSNFLLYLGLYQPMANGIKNLDLGVILPLILGVVLVIFLFARVVSWLFRKHHTLMYHIIIGIVIGSTAAIIPSGVSGIGVILACALLFLVGAAASFGLAKLDEKHPHESLF